jgi:tetratricopeptide (TPR) repeat protein
MMRQLLAIFILVLSAQAMAADFSFVPQQSDEQKDLYENLTKSKWSNALELWAKAFPGSGFGTSDNGRALRIYLLAMNGLPVSSTKLLLRETTYQNLNAGVLEMWRPLIDSYISELPQGMMNVSWKRHFSSDTSSDYARAKSLWAFATKAPQTGDTAGALRALNSLSTLHQSLIGADQLELATGRVLYQQGKLDEAITHYNKVPKNSDLWLETLEERAWAYLKKGDHDHAMGDITTALAPVFSSVTGPESYFLSELSDLQVCDYPKILRTSRSFKERSRDRLKALEELASSGTNKAVNQAMSDIETKGLSVVAVGSNVKFMPRNFLRDGEFSRAIKYRRELMNEAKVSKDVLSKIGGDGEMEALLNENNADIAQAKATAFARLRKLAAGDVQEFRMIINKLHIIEAEVIERLYVDESLQGKRRDLVKTEDPKNTISFPYSEEVWMDELDHYKTVVKDCPGLQMTKGASL